MEGRARIPTEQMQRQGKRKGQRLIYCNALFLACNIDSILISMSNVCVLVKIRNVERKIRNHMEQEDSVILVLRPRNTLLRNLMTTASGGREPCLECGEVNVVVDVDLETLLPLVSKQNSLPTQTPVAVMNKSHRLRSNILVERIGIWQCIWCTTSVVSKAILACCQSCHPNTSDAPTWPWRLTYFGSK